MKRIEITICTLFILLCFTKLQADGFQTSNNQMKGLAILGDAWHCAAPQYMFIVKQMEKKGIITDVVYDYDVPFDKLADYDIIVISRYGLNDLESFEGGYFLTPEWHKNKWLTGEQEKLIEEYVNQGGKLLLHHDAHAFYSENGSIAKLAKATHDGHPPAIKTKIYPTEELPELTKGVEAFEVVDEEFRMEIDESTTVFLKSHSEKNGTTNQGWAHDYGKGKVVVLVPGHDINSFKNSMVKLLISNTLDYLNR